MKDEFRKQIRKTYDFSNGKKIHTMREDSTEKPFIVMDSYNMIIGECDTWNEAKELI